MSCGSLPGRTNREHERDPEFDSMVEHLERVSFTKDASPEELAPAALLERLVMAYDDEHYPMPEIKPHVVPNPIGAAKAVRKLKLAPP